VRRAQGSAELGVTQNASYLDDLMSRASTRGKYQVGVEFEVKPGTFESLISQAAVHPSAAPMFPNLPLFKKGMTVPQIKLEKDGVLSILLGGSDDAVKQFNSNIITIRKR